MSKLFLLSHPASKRRKKSSSIEWNLPQVKDAIPIPSTIHEKVLFQKL